MDKHQVLLEYYKKASQADHIAATEILQQITATEDVGLIMRAEYLACIAGFANATTDEEKKTAADLFQNHVRLIEAVRKENEEAGIEIDMYDEFSILNLKAHMAKLAKAN